MMFVKVAIYRFPYLLEISGFFFLKIPGLGKSWKITLVLEKFWKLKLKVLESPVKISLKITHFFIGSCGKQAAIVYHPVCVDCYFAEVSAMDYTLNVVSK